MPYATDEKLKNYLDANQLHREQICLAILALDKRYKNVCPRHPRGGPDGRRDIEATYKDGETVYGAVGFLNQAADIPEYKNKIKLKFTTDLDSAMRGEAKPSVFVFFTRACLKTQINHAISTKS